MKTWRQWRQIDLIAEVVVQRGSHTENIVLNIENKWYSQVGANQLQSSREAIENEYDSRKETWIIRNLLIYCDFEKITPDLMNHCREQGYLLLSIGDLQRICGFNDGAEKTGNNLFDEYWFWT